MQDQTPDKPWAGQNFMIDSRYPRDVDHLDEPPEEDHLYAEDRAPVYPERFATMTAVMLDDSTLEMIRGALSDQFMAPIARLGLAEWRNDPQLAADAATKLWAIDRACRVLGIDS